MPSCKRDRILAGACAAALAVLPTTSHAGIFGGKPAAQPAAAAAPAKGKAADDTAPRKADPAARAAAERLDPLARAAFWAHETQVDPTDITAGVKLSGALRALQRFDEAGQSADRVLVMAPQNEEALLEAAKSRIEARQGFYALDYLKRAKAVAPSDWRVPSLYGVAYGQTKRLEEARVAFAEALKLSPENPAVLSNLALTLAEAGQTTEAEPLLRRAAASPQAGAAERQNLALVLGLEGKLGEAEGLLRRDLPPEAADANLAYLQAANHTR